MPEGVPVRYLFRPEENRVRMALDLSRPFTNLICVGKARTAYRAGPAGTLGFAARLLAALAPRGAALRADYRHRL